jgi:hypothetical protein
VLISYELIRRYNGDYPLYCFDYLMDWSNRRSRSGIRWAGLRRSRMRRVSG